MKNRKGSSVIWGFILIFVSLLAAIFLGLAIFGFNLVNEALSQDVEVGQVNLKNISDTTFGAINTGMLANGDTIGIIMLLGMCVLMILNGYFTGSQNPRMFFVIDIFLLALFFIPAIYVSQVYNTFINSTSLFSDVYINTLPKVSKFVLNLPSIIATTGIITMILSYSRIKKRKEDEVNVEGF